ncbi:MAG: hypothetical protein EXS05_20030 [Planctomycetaceae bacterium]|nr:hypothetical protein [Planctomycetaceae bacterium]
MSEIVTLELTPQQREIVLEGLRCVRNSRRFEFREPSDPANERRETDLRVVGELLGQLGPTVAATVPARA